MRKQRTKERSTTVYIPPQAKSCLQTVDDARFPLMEKVKEFLNSEQRVFLLLGDSGAGKTTFSRELEFELWQMYKTKTGRIPLHINLPAIDKPEHDLVAKQLRKEEFTESQISELKHYRKFILVCDGYDESQQTHNLYMSNRLNQPGEWDAQMVISCRSEYLGNDYRDRFQPGDRNQTSESSLFQEAVITPFSIDQVQAYIHQYVSIYQPMWQTKDYKQALELIPSLKDLVKNPFLMTLSLEVLPRMVDPGQRLSAARITRVGLYDQFVEQWLERGKKRLAEKDLSPQARATFESLSEEGFTQNGIDFMKRLSVAIYKEQCGQPVVEYSRSTDEGSWKDAFFNREDRRLLREACPMTRNGNQHRFIHRSLLEYGLARAVFDPKDRKNRSTHDAHFGRRQSLSSTFSIESQDSEDENDITCEQEPDFDSPLVGRGFTNDHSFLHFLEERVQQEPVFKEQLLSYIEHSKKDKKWRKAAANAITILVRAGVQFIGADLRGIRIPRADLSYGVFDSVQLQDADMRKVNLRGVWLRETDLSRAQMTDVQFGEYPFLTEDGNVFSCAYSSDGNASAVGLASGDISVYTTSNWEKTRTLRGHSDVTRSVAFSPKGDLIASCSQDETVRLWSAETGSLEHTLTGHGTWILCVVFSPQGDQVASGSDDKTVRVWDVGTGGCCQTLSGHNGGVTCVAYPPTGLKIASGSTDFTIRVWDIETGFCSRILPGHCNKVWAIAYSHRGDQIASASGDTTVRLWDAETGVCNHILAGHSSIVHTVAYSPNGDQIASGSGDTTVRLWDVEQGICSLTLAGHNANVTSVMYSPKGGQLASSSFDKTVRLWDVSAGVSRFVSRGHSGEVKSVVYSQEGDGIASGSKDGTVKLWDVATGDCRRTLSGHCNAVCSVVYSPRGEYIASGSADNSLKLWDVETGACLQTLTGHGGWVNGISYRPQGDQLASASQDTTLRIWDIATGRCLATLNGHTGAVMSVAHSPDGNRIASGGKDSTVRLWDIETENCCCVLEGHGDWVWEVAYSPQRDRLASGSGDNTVRLWDTEIGECCLVLTGHRERVVCVSYSMQGDLLASGSHDRTVRVWDITTGQCRAVIENFQDDVKSIALSAVQGTNFLVTGCKDGSVAKWQIIEDDDQYNVQLRWAATSGSLTVAGTSMQGVRGLTQLNKHLLKQRRAVGEPEHLLREASKKLITMASLVSKLKKTTDGMVLNSPFATDRPADQLEQLGQ